MTRSSGGGVDPARGAAAGPACYGSDLNRLAVMIGKAMIRDPAQSSKDHAPPSTPASRSGRSIATAEGLAEDVKFYGEWMREKALHAWLTFIPDVDLPAEYGGGKATVAAWIMGAYGPPSPDPAFGDVRVPIASTFMLSSRTGKEVWIEPIVDRVNKSIRYSIRKGGTKAGDCYRE